jgi:hypothetical protein
MLAAAMKAWNLVVVMGHLPMVIIGRHAVALRGCRCRQDRNGPEFNKRFWIAQGRTTVRTARAECEYGQQSRDDVDGPQQRGIEFVKCRCGWGVLSPGVSMYRSET